MIRLLLLSLVVTFLFLPFSGNSCCAEDQYVLTELLNDPTESRYNNYGARNIFIIQIEKIGTHPQGGHLSKGIVQEVFRGDLNIGEKINIGSGGNTSAGGRKLMVGKKYIIFSRPNNDGEYYAFVCDSYSAPIDENKKGKHKSSDRGTAIKDVVTKYFQLQKKKYSGKVSFKIDGKTIGKGRFKNGVPHGKWKHYHHNYSKKFLKSEIEYKHGKLDGTEKMYRSHQKNKLSKVTEFKEGRPIQIANYLEEDNQHFLYSKTEITYTSNNLERRKTSCFYPDEKIKSLYHVNFTGLKRVNTFYADKYEDGLHETYFPNGQLETTGQFHLGAKVGIWKTYLEDGTLKEEKNYPTPDDAIAPFVIFHKAGNPRIIGQVDNGKRTGEWKAFSEKGQLAQIATFQNDKIHGVHQAFRIEEKTIYREENYQNGIRHGEYRTFQKNGKDIANIVIYENGKKEGEEKRFFENGAPLYHATYINGKLEGTLVSYISPNIIYRKENYKGGLKHGTIEVYSRDGNLSGKGNYVMGIKSGTWYYYYPSGNLRSKCTYRANHPESQVHYSVPDSCEEFEEDGTPKKKK